MIDSTAQYQYKGSTVTGKLSRKSPNGTLASPIWFVIPTDRRRNTEEVPERALGKVIDKEEALSNRGITPSNFKKPGSKSPASVTQDTSGSDESVDEPQAKRRSGRSSSSDDSPKDKKRKTGESEEDDQRKTVTFNQKAKKAKNAAGSTRVGTRSTRGPTEAILLPEHPVRKKNLFKKKKIKKDENVKVVRMLTGTLYLYRGERPRAEFIRFK